MTTTELTCCCVTNPKCPEHSTDVTEPAPICDCGVPVDEHGGEMDDCPGDPA